jgi:Type IV pilin-like G and H, putative
MLKFGWGAIGLLVVSNVLTRPAIAKPPTNPGNLITSKSEVGTRMSALSDYQIAYFQQHGRFGKTLQEVGSQPAINGKPQPIAATATYSYRVLPHPQSGNMTLIAAVPKQSGRPTLIGLLSGTQTSNRPDGKGGKETLTIGILCQSKAPGAAIPSWSSIGKPNPAMGFACPAGF